jgi:hypothetical protein
MIHIKVVFYKNKECEAVVSWQWAMGNGQWAMGNGLLFTRQFTANLIPLLP